MTQVIGRPGWKAAKLAFGSLYLLLAAFGGWMLYRMAEVRAGMVNLESGLFLARALVLMAMGACLLMAVWGFVSARVCVAHSGARHIIIALAAIFGVVCLIFCGFAFIQVTGAYAAWPDGALF